MATFNRSRGEESRHAAAGLARRAWQTLTTGLRHRTREERERRELAALSDLQLADIGFNRSDIAAVARNSGLRGARLERMLRRLDVAGHPDLDDLAFRRALERTCSTCLSARRCEAWLDRAAVEPGCPAFCPNAYELTLMMRQPGRARRIEGRDR